VELTVPLTESSWKIYKAMRDEMVAFLRDSNEVSVAPQAITKIMRLAQITSGFLGGLEEEPPLDAEPIGDRPEWLPSTQTPIASPSNLVVSPAEDAVREIGREKLDLLLSVYDDWLTQDKNLKLVVWSRFRVEMFRMVKEIRERYPQGIEICTVVGGQKKAEREVALRLLDPRTAPTGPVFAAGTYGTGSLGLNFTACHTVINCSYDHSLFKFLQSGDRFDRPGQLYPTSYFDIVSTGPKGQKTIDHLIIKARNDKENLANWTAAAWVQRLTEE
jgi:hypothetical protein